MEDDVLYEVLEKLVQVLEKQNTILDKLDIVIRQLNEIATERERWFRLVLILLAALLALVGIKEFPWW